MYKELLKKIKDNDKISIFRHSRPDGDSVFSTLALYYFLKENFKDKSIKLCGNDKFDLINKSDKVSDKFITDSLAIVLDTATSERIDDFRAMSSKYLIKIDHHPITENYGDLNIVNTNASSACEVLAEILLSKEFSKYKISTKVYKYLYCGIVTDTINFRTTNTSGNTLEIASKLVKNGKLKPSDLVEYLTDVDLLTYKKITQIRNKLNVKNKFGYIKLSEKELKKLDLKPVEAKNNIDEIGKIKDLNIWAFAVQNEGHWDCSIRSKRGYIINKVAYKYNGGGHPNAAATRRLNASKLNSLLKELSILSTK